MISRIGLIGAALIQAAAGMMEPMHTPLRRIGKRDGVQGAKCAQRSGNKLAKRKKQGKKLWRV